METFHPGADVPCNAVQGARALVLPCTGVLGHGDDWCEPCASIPLPLSPCQAALGLQQEPRCPPQCPGSAGWPHLQPQGSREVPGEVCGAPWALLGTSRDKRRDSGLSPQVACGKPGVTAGVTSSKALGKDVGEAVLVVRLWWLLSSSALQLLQRSCPRADTNLLLLLLQSSLTRMLSDLNSTLYFLPLYEQQIFSQHIPQNFPPLLYRMQGIPRVPELTPFMRTWHHVL